jgi:hypothetical protein
MRRTEFENRDFLETGMLGDISSTFQKLRQAEISQELEHSFRGMTLHDRSLQAAKSREFPKKEACFLFPNNHLS